MDWAFTFGGRTPKVKTPKGNGTTLVELLILCSSSKYILPVDIGRYNYKISLNLLDQWYRRI